MNIKEYFSADLRTTLIYAVLGVIAGYLSFVLNSPKLALVSVSLVLALSTITMKYILKVSSYRWFLSNGVAMFVFTWFVVWTVFYNITTAV